MVVVVFATPPFWFTTAIMSVIYAGLSPISSAILKYHSTTILSRVFSDFRKMIPQSRVIAVCQTK
jgi:hypothetical protein